MQDNNNNNARQRVVSIYDQLKLIPSITSGKFISQEESDSNNNTTSLSTIELTQSVSDYKSNTSQNFIKTYHVINTIDNNNAAIIHSNFPSQLSSDIHLQTLSPSGKIKVIFRNISKDANKVEYQVEVHNNFGLFKKIYLKEQLHDKIVNDNGDVFQRICWNKKETKLLYIAEKKKKDIKPIWDFTTNKKEEKDTNNNEDKKEISNNVYENMYDYDLKEDWGEQLLFIEPKAFELNLEKNEIIALETKNISVATPIYDNNDNIYFIGLDKPIRKLGIKFYSCRHSKLYNYPNLECFSEEFRNVRKPILSRDGKYLIALVTEQHVNYHYSNSKLVKMMLSGDGKVTDKIELKLNMEIYTNDLQLNAFTNNSKFIIINSIYKSRQCILLVNTDNGNVINLNDQIDESQLDSMAALDLKNNNLLFYRSIVNRPFELFKCKLDEENGKLNNIVKIDDYTNYLNNNINNNTPLIVNESLLKDVKVSIERISIPQTSFEMECIFIIPPKQVASENLPLISYPHGGPHGACLTVFNAQILNYVLNGYAIVEINYRGSVGFGQEFNECLLGNVGDMDVKDCQLAVDHILQKYATLIDKNRISIIGGSHGGFLGAHLVGQYPDNYRCTILRNPVINLSTIYGESDIPDWAYCESLGIKFYDEKFPKKEEIVKMYECSPIRYVDKVKAPVLLLVGEVDRRVPKEQPREFYYALKHLGRVVKMLVYPENDHPIAKPAAEFDAMIEMDRAFLFDIDGVLCNSDPLIATSLLLAAEDVKQNHQLNFTSPSHELLKTLIHGAPAVGIRKIMVELIPELSDHQKELLDLTYKHFYILLKKSDNKTFPIHTSIILLKNLVKLNCKVYLVSNLIRDAIKNYIETLGLTDCLLQNNNSYSFVGYEDFTPNPKPHPEPYLLAAKLLNVDPSKCIVFEDSEDGVLSGKRAGMTVIGLTSNDNMKQKLIKIGVDEVVSNLLESEILKTVLYEKSNYNLKEGIKVSIVTLQNLSKEEREQAIEESYKVYSSIYKGRDINTWRSRLSQTGFNRLCLCYNKNNELIGYFLVNYKYITYKDKPITIAMFAGGIREQYQRFNILSIFATLETKRYAITHPNERIIAFDNCAIPQPNKEISSEAKEMVKYISKEMGYESLDNNNPFLNKSYSIVKRQHLGHNGSSITINKADKLGSFFAEQTGLKEGVGLSVIGDVSYSAPFGVNIPSDIFDNEAVNDAANTSTRISKL
ncbi:hypothetical protein ABK040_005871 [Willaertia magna]